MPPQQFVIQVLSHKMEIIYSKTTDNSKTTLYCHGSYITITTTRLHATVVKSINIMLPPNFIRQVLCKVRLANIGFKCWLQSNNADIILFAAKFWVPMFWIIRQVTCFAVCVFKAQSDTSTYHHKQFFWKFLLKIFTQLLSDYCVQYKLNFSISVRRVGKAVATAW